MNEMIDISKLKTYSKPHKVYIPSKYGCFVKKADLEQLLETAHNSDYAKLPSLHDVMDIIRPNGAGQEIPEIVRRVYETIKKLGDFA